MPWTPDIIIIRKKKKKKKKTWRQKYYKTHFNADAMIKVLSVNCENEAYSCISRNVRYQFSQSATLILIFLKIAVRITDPITRIFALQKLSSSTISQSSDTGKIFHHRHLWHFFKNTHTKNKPEIIRSVAYL